MIVGEVRVATESRRKQSNRAEGTGVLWAGLACKGTGGSLQGRGGQKKMLDFDGKAPDLWCVSGPEGGLFPIRKLRILSG